jgi:dTMP kinase
MFVTIEGIDGSGKTYLTKLITDWLNSEEPGSTISTSEPYDRSILDRGDAWETKEWEFYRDRIIHWAEVIAPALAEEKNVICDRFQLSTVVYQHEDDLMFTNTWQKYARYVLGREKWNATEALEVGVLEPDCVILINGDLKACLERLLERGEYSNIDANKILDRKTNFYRAIFAYENATRYCLTEASTIIIAQTADEAFERFKAWVNGDGKRDNPDEGGVQ